MFHHEYLQTSELPKETLPRNGGRLFSAAEKKEVLHGVELWGKNLADMCYVLRVNFEVRHGGSNEFRIGYQGETEGLLREEELTCVTSHLYFRGKPGKVTKWGRDCATSESDVE